MRRRLSGPVPTSLPDSAATAPRPGYTAGMVRKWGALGPFKPGPGGMPPYLAGRGPEQRLLRDFLQDLRDGVPLPSEVILYGPRGNGKTVLLGWLEAEAESVRPVEAVVLLPSSIPDTTRLAERLLPKSWWDRLTPDEVKLAGVSWRPGEGGPSPAPEDVLAARARKAPLLVVMDEAHTVDLEVGRALLNASQKVRQDYPFLLVLAGTPNLQGHLGAMGASFWNRMKQLRIGRLDETATAEAFRRPFEEAGIAVAADALAGMVSLSHGYPYFIQLLGQQAWRRVSRGDSSGELTAAVLERARPGFEEAKVNYYQHRFFELRKRRLLPVARSVAASFAECETLSIVEVDCAIRAGLDDPSDDEAADRAELALSDLGFIWGTSAKPGWEPGIPSLMDYVAEFAPAG